VLSAARSKVRATFRGESRLIWVRATCDPERSCKPGRVDDLDRPQSRGCRHSQPALAGPNAAATARPPYPQKQKVGVRQPSASSAVTNNHCAETHIRASAPRHNWKHNPMDGDRTCLENRPAKRPGESIFSASTKTSRGSSAETNGLCVALNASRQMIRAVPRMAPFGARASHVLRCVGRRRRPLASRHPSAFRLVPPVQHERSPHGGRT
jgi:hypothetical protein